MANEITKINVSGVDFTLTDTTKATASDLAQEQTARQEADSNLQAQIDELVAGSATLSLSVSPSVFFKGESTSIKITGTCSKKMSECELRQGNTLLKSETDVTSISDTVSVTETASFTLRAKVSGGMLSPKAATATAVLPIYVGAGSAYTDVAIEGKKQTARTNPSGTYNVTVASNGQYVFFIIPATMTITSAKMNGFDFPLEMEEQTIGENAYKIYKSNSLDAGTISVVIS